MSEEYAQVDIEPCPACGQPLAFASRFKRFGWQHVQVCRYCCEVWHNGKRTGAVEVGPRKELA